MTGLNFAIIVCVVIGGLFLLFGLVLAASVLLGREKKEKPVAVVEETGFFNTSSTAPKLAAAARTRGPVANDYADLTDLPGVERSRGTNEISKPLSHKEIFGSLLEDDTDLNNQA